MGERLIIVPYQHAHTTQILGYIPPHAPPDSKWQVTALRGDTPIAAGGITLQWPEPSEWGYVGLAWFICNAHLTQRWRVRVLRALVRLWRQWQGEFSYVEMNCLPGGAGERLALLCGMQWKCRRAKYLHGCDVTLYAWEKP